MRGCEDEKMFYRPLLLEEPCAQTLSGISLYFQDFLYYLYFFKETNNFFYIFKLY